MSVDPMDKLQSHFEARITELEAENQALREFVAVADEWTSWCVCCMDEYEQEFRPVMQRYYAIRQRLATDHNLPLPGDRRTGADSA